MGKSDFFREKKGKTTGDSLVDIFNFPVDYFELSTERKIGNHFRKSYQLQFTGYPPSSMWIMWITLTKAASLFSG